MGKEQAAMGREQAWSAGIGREQIGMGTACPGALLPAQAGRQGPRNPWAWGLPLALCLPGAAGRAYLLPPHCPEGLQHPRGPG